MKKITVIGSGYVGLVSGAGLSEFGNDVTCVDIDEERILLLNEGKIPIYEPGLLSLVKKNYDKNRLSFSSEISKEIIKSDIIFIAVGTPQDKNGNANINSVLAVAETIGKNLNSYKVICTKSTVPVGTGKKIESVINSLAENTKFDYVSNPEFLREGAAVKDFLKPDRIVVGARSKKALRWMADIYRSLYLNNTPLFTTSVETAEMIKYASNSFLALKISYINEVANLCEEVGADVHEVALAMGQDGRISSKFLHPGPGFGGSCFPKDAQAFLAIAKDKKITLNTVEAAINTNINQKMRMISKLKKLFNNNISGKVITILGLAFKPETDDIREAPSQFIVSELIKMGVDIHAYDPVAMDNFKIKFPEIKYFNDWQSASRSSDGCVILTEWNEFRGIDLKHLKSLLNNPILLDTKNIFSMKKLELLGFKYDNVGRKKII